MIYTDFVNMARQETMVKKLLPLEVGDTAGRVQDYAHQHLTAAYHEPAERDPR
jgi:F0F1-type ATP synthase gamma subunit